MLDTLTDIRQRLHNQDYRTREQVCLTLVARLVQQVGWDIWNPHEVVAGAAPAHWTSSPGMNLTLTAPNAEATTIFIECKAVGSLTQDLLAAEKQLRDYQPCSTALFTLLTDGRHWRFYYARPDDKPADQLFCQIDLLTDSLPEVAGHLLAFLHRDNVLNRSAHHRAIAGRPPSAEQGCTTPATTSQQLLALVIADTEPADPPLPPRFLLQRPKAGFQAEGYWRPTGTMHVLAGSTATVRVSSSISAAGYELRQHLLQTGVLRACGSKLRFDQDYEFDSPNRAAEVVCGGTVNARIAWLRAGSGQTLGSYLTSSTLK